MGLVKKMIICLVIATSVALACYFLPVVNAVFGSYLLGFYIAALVVPLGIRGYESHAIKARRYTQSEKAKREAECRAWHEEDREATTSASQSYDARNIDRVLNVYDGFKDK